MNNQQGDWKKKYTTIYFEYGKVIFVCCLIVVSMASVYLIVSLISPHKLRVSFLDVGQGDAILIQTPSGKSMLIDGGPTNIVLEKMAHEMSYFDNDIDVMVETHPDADHITGLIPVLEKYKVSTMVISPAEGSTKIVDDLTSHIVAEHTDTHIARSGDSIDFHDGVVVKILYPRANYVGKKSDTNDASVSIVITYGDESFLLTGDLPSKEESKLLNEDLPKHVTVYKVGHHGSKYSSGEQLLTYIKPEYAVVSAGKDNKYGHPNIETIDRLQKYAQEILSTIDRGTISFIADGRMMEVETTR